jgi:hypothetical protein
MLSSKGIRVFNPPQLADRWTTTRRPARPRIAITWQAGCPLELGQEIEEQQHRPKGGVCSRSSASPPHMFNFSANHLFLVSRTEYRKCAVFLLRDLDTQRVYRLYDFTKALLLRPGVAYSVAGKVNSADKLYLVIESVRLDTKHSRSSNALVPADGAGGSGIG